MQKIRNNNLPEHPPETIYFDYTVFAGATARALYYHLWGFVFCYLFESALDSDTLSVPDILCGQPAEQCRGVV